FHAAARATYDVVLAMYHDQALIPIKTLAFDHAVNVTLGLPFVRTSPDHGTAFDIAGSGKADPTSLIAAIRLAARLSAPSTGLRAIGALEEIAERNPGRVEIVCGDALAVDPRQFLLKPHARVVANLPYNIASALLVGWLTVEPWPPWYDQLVLMFQREVAARI